MHELAVTQGILDIAVAEAEKAGNRKVINIKIKLGVFTGLVPQCIQEYYDLISEDTVAEGAELIFEKIPAVIHCESCGADSTIDRFRLRCPVCNENRVRIVSGKEFYIDSMEVEDGD